MPKFYFYFGPKIGFDNFLSEKIFDLDDFTTFSALVRTSDERNRVYKVVGDSGETFKQDRIQLENLVVYSDDYASVKEHVVINFDGFISAFEIENIYLQNPPELLFKKLKKLYSDSEVEYYGYSSLSEKKLIEIYEDYNNVIIGQPEVLRHLLISLIPLTLPKNKKPVVLLFWGPSGVGKTETAKFLANKLGGELFRKQFSMFQNNEFMTYLFGGNHYEKSFAKELLERETNVILLDEFDKANSVFHSAFYQLFDEGIFEDKNYSAQIGSSIIICTSNYDSLENIRDHLGDPIFSRFDACIQFLKLKEDSIRIIIETNIGEEISKLEDLDKEFITKESVMELFEKNIHRIENARRIRSLVREVIYSKVLSRILSNKS